MTYEHARSAARRLTRDLSEEERVALMRRWLRDHPHRPAPYDVVVWPENIPVWAIIGGIQAAKGNLCTVADGYDVQLDAVRAALAYYLRFPEIIQARLDANEGVSYLESLV